MSSLKSFIQNEVLLKRLQSNDVLVVYDPDQSYGIGVHRLLAGRQRKLIVTPRRPR